MLGIVDCAVTNGLFSVQELDPTDVNLSASEKELDVKTLVNAGLMLGHIYLCFSKYLNPDDCVLLDVPLRANDKNLKSANEPSFPFIYGHWGQLLQSLPGRWPIDLS